MSIYLALDEGQSGPHSPDEIRTMLVTGIISEQQLAWREGMAEWRPVGEILPLSIRSPIKGLPPLPPIGHEPPSRPHAPAAQINWIPALVLQSIALALGIIVDLLKIGSDDDISQHIAILGLPIVAVAIVLWAILHYRCWQALPGRYAKTTPGKAVGFLFIPFYNFYWVFVSFVELAKGFAAHAKDSKSARHGDLTGIAIAFSILFICTFTIGLIPGITSLVSIASFVLFVLFYRVVVRYANDAIGHPPN